MKNTDWKATAELIGIAAIVASLVFVGMQMEQSQQLAFAESALSMRANSLEQGGLEAEYVDIWVRGNADVELTDIEREIYRILYTQKQNQAFYDWIALDYIDTQFEGVGPQTMARFLVQNPGARAEWNRRRAETNQLGITPDGIFPEFAALVEADLRKLDVNLSQP